MTDNIATAEPLDDYEKMFNECGTRLAIAETKLRAINMQPDQDHRLFACIAALQSQYDAMDKMFGLMVDMNNYFVNSQKT